MNCLKIYKKICKKWNQFDFELKSGDKEKVSFNANLVAEKYFDDHLFVQIVIYSSGSMHVTFTFDQLDDTSENLWYVNEFNDGTSFAKAYISEKKGGKYLEVHYANICAEEEEAVVNYFAFVLDDLLDESVLKYLRPLTAKTN